MLTTFVLFAESPREVVGKLCRLTQTLQGTGGDVFAEENSRAKAMSARALLEALVDGSSFFFLTKCFRSLLPSPEIRTTLF